MRYSYPSIKRGRVKTDPRSAPTIPDQYPGNIPKGVQAPDIPPATIPPEEAIACSRTGLLLRIRHRYPDAAEITSRMEALPERN